MSTPTRSPPPERRPRAKRKDPDVRREDLLKVTISCLARLGPTGATGREICRQAGVSHSLLRHYFADPNDLLLETYQRLSDSFIARLEKELAGEPEAWAALDRLLLLHFSDEWSGPEILGAWIGFWTLARNRQEFEQVRDGLNQRIGALIIGILRRIPVRPGALAVEDAAAIVGGVMDGLWLEFGLSSNVPSRERGIALCHQTARKLLGS